MHGPAQTRPPLDQVIAALKETGVNEFGASGYCFGGTISLLTPLLFVEIRDRSALRFRSCF